MSRDVAVLVSGRGSNLRALAAAMQEGTCRGTLRAVVADRPCDALGWASSRGLETRVVEARLLEGNIDAFRAEWRLAPSVDGEHTRVAFRIFVDPDLPLPSSLISRENERAARRSIEALRARLEGKLP